MRLLKLVFFLSLIPTITFARGGGGGGHAGGGGGGFRSGGGGGFRGGSVGRGFRGGSVGGFRGGGFAGGGFRGGFRGGSRFFVGGFYGWPYAYGWGYPYYYGGYPYYDYGYPYDYSPYDYGNYDNGYGYVSQPSYQSYPPAQPAVINQNYAAPAAPAGNSGASFYRTPDFYLIAFNDHTIRAALSFRVEGDQIRWTTREHEEKQAPLSSVDRSFSEQINRDRRIQFRLP